MISRALRFHGYNALRGVYRQGRVVRGRYGMLRFCPTPVPRQQHYRLAIVVSKKVSKSAVVRNRIRRRLFEAGRELLPQNLAYDIVITATDVQLAVIDKKHIYNIFYDFLQIIDKAARPVENYNREHYDTKVKQS